MALAWSSEFTNEPSSFKDAPPPYYSVVGDTHQDGKFTFVDFLPELCERGGCFKQPKYETFSTVIDKANNWLKVYPGWEMIRCESVEFSSECQSVDSEKMSYIKYGEHFNFYLRGLRLWIRERNRSENVQKIGYINLIPEQTNERRMFTRPKFESLQELITRFNSMNRMNPIPGRIVTVESQEIHTCNWKVDADRSNWFERGDSSEFFIFIIRIFYEIMSAEPEEIGIQDFLPDIVESGRIFANPISEPFSNVVQKASDWWVRQSGFRFCNAQSVEIRIKKGDVNTNRMDYMQYGSGATYYARILRLAYVRSSQSNINYGAPSSIRRLVCKTFVPVQLKESMIRAEFETLSQTKERLFAWIRATGAHIISAETAALRIRSRKEVKDGPEATFSYNVARWTEHRIFVIRLYLDDVYPEPLPEALPPVPEIIVDTGCCILS